MKLKILGLFLLAGFTSAFTLAGDKGKIVKVKAFKKFIDPIGLKFELPEGYKATYVKENKDLWYAFAMKDTKADFEVRYSVWSLKPALADYEKCKLDSNCMMIKPNLLYIGRIKSNVLNMTGGKSGRIDPFPANAAIEEFNANTGGSSFFELNCAFGEGYKYGQMVYLHRDNVADVIITYLSNDKQTHSSLMEKPFHALVFK